MIRQQARRIRTVEREDLEGELARRLVDRKSRPLSTIRNWDAYLNGFLRKKASNWIRDWRSRWEDKKVVLPESREDDANDRMEPFLASLGRKLDDRDVDQKVAVAQFWNGLNPGLRRMCELLDEEDGNITRVAIRMGKHPNTIRQWRRKVQQLWKRHGL